MNYKYYLLIILTATLLNGCCSKNVYFNKQIYATKNNLVAQADNGIIRTYQDNVGDFYPEEISGNSLGLNDIRSDSLEWENDQEKIQTNIAEKIISKLKEKNGNKPQTLFIMIHGFNVSSAEGAYAHVRDIVDSFSGQDEQPVYWQVNWDGRTGGSITAAIGAWLGTQSNGPLVGLKMRRILNKIVEKNQDLRIRILTHSSGAFVAASLLGNNTNALELAQESMASNCGKYYKFYCENIKDLSENGKYRVPQPNDLRLGMLAPATPFNSFAMLPTNPNDEYQRSSTDGLLVKKIKMIVGTNPEDIATSKAFLPADWFGATSLAVGSENCRKLHNGLNDMKNDRLLPRDIEAKCINFAFSSTYNETAFKFWESHDLSVYLQRDMMPKFLTLLLK